ncbi:hypothetical protein B0A50_06837 [Salinomyces thailandicus]|uniref:glucan 1,3-beta-glucosidase n=1 Tax=Salinomyces thailandicus TaxID=706561 RepID=A0A4U0TQ24_9PEZI|nr:hypothetical protein B0A50_06837 [Salinomyces thailandica]
MAPLRSSVVATTAALLASISNVDAAAVPRNGDWHGPHGWPGWNPHWQTTTTAVSTVIVTTNVSPTTVYTTPGVPITSSKIASPTSIASSDIPTYPSPEVPTTTSTMTSPTSESPSAWTTSPASVAPTTSSATPPPSYSSSTTTSTAPISTPSGTTPSVIRGVNLGGWLVLEKWLNSDLFSETDALDQYHFDQSPNALSKLQNHWDTFITEDDIRQIADIGINTLRIPIGYWAYDNSNTPYITGADTYMEKAIGWARKYSLKVLVDLHGAPGSQNGFDSSGSTDQVAWQTGDNMDKTISVLETMAQKYGAQEYADVVWGLELVNEPLGWSPNNFTLSQIWSQKAYAAVKAKATNPDLTIFMHDSFQKPEYWTDTVNEVNGNDATFDTSRFALDTHLYQNQVESDSELDQSQHIAKACEWANTDLLGRESSVPVVVGEFSAATNICANPDGTTVAGFTCTDSGCQCASNVWIEDWEAPLIEATRKFLEAQLDVFEHSSMGWIIWTWNGPGGWGLRSMSKYGIIGNQVTDRKYPGQCQSYF